MAHPSTHMPLVLGLAGALLISGLLSSGLLGSAYGTTGAGASGGASSTGRLPSQNLPHLAESAANDGRLRFRADGTFAIFQLTDLHYGENDEMDAKSDELQRAVLAAEKPDLVVFSGDMVSGWVCKKGSAQPPGGQACGPGWFEARWEQLTAPVKAAGLPWAIILGNHDAEAELSRREIVDLAIRTGGTFSLTRQGPAQATGASNYFLHVHPPLRGGETLAGDVAAAAAEAAAAAAAAAALEVAQGTPAGAGAANGASGPGQAGALDAAAGGARVAAAMGGAAGNDAAHVADNDDEGDGPVARVWLLDSMDRTCPPLMFGWGCVGPDTLAWLNRTANSLPRVPSLAFVHVPVPQFRDVWFDTPTVGLKQEDVACSVRDTGLFSMARALGIHAIYSGHDHNNDYAGVLDGIRLGYGRKSGYGGYGPPQGWLRGARVIRLRMGQDTARSDTWIRQEDGTKSRQRQSQQAKDMRQLICHCDEFEAQPELRQQALDLLLEQEQKQAQEQGRRAGEDSRVQIEVPDHAGDHAAAAAELATTA